MYKYVLPALVYELHAGEFFGGGIARQLFSH